MPPLQNILLQREKAATGCLKDNEEGGMGKGGGGL